MSCQTEWMWGMLAAGVNLYERRIVPDVSLFGTGRTRVCILLNKIKKNKKNQYTYKDRQILQNIMSTNYCFICQENEVFEGFPMHWTVYDNFGKCKEICEPCHNKYGDGVMPRRCDSCYRKADLHYIHDRIRVLNGERLFRCHKCKYYSL